MGIVTDPTADAGLSEDRAEGETASEDPGHLHENSPADANPNHPSGSNGIHLPSKTSPTDPVADGAEAKPAFEFSPAPAHIHNGHSAGAGLFSFLSGGIPRGGSGGIPRHGSGAIRRHGSEGIPRHGSGGIPRHGSGVGPNRGGSGGVGGIHRGRSGVHLPSLASINFSMSRLPEEDAGLQMHFTETKEVEAFPESPVATDDDAVPGKSTNRMRKYLTAVGACSFGFRLAECVFSLISIIVMCADSQYMGVDVGTLKFNHFQAYNYLVAVNVIVFVYSTLQFIQLAYTVIYGMSFIPSIFLSTWLTFGFDQLFSYFLLSASTSAATVANMSYTGEMGVRFCSRFDLGSFCARADAAVTMSFFTFFAMLSSTILAIYRIALLLREY